MKKTEKILHISTSIFGIISMFCLATGYFFFETLRPKMVNFSPIPENTDYLMNFVGIGIIFIFAFHLSSFFRLLIFLKSVKKITLFYIGLFVANIVSLVFIFGDLALLSDIGKQYKHGLSQPEWSVLYIVMAFQSLFIAIITYVNTFKLKKNVSDKSIAKDVNIFIITQYVGVITGSMGLFATIVNFLFPRPLWMIKLHVTMSGIILIIPFVLIVIYWFFVKMMEKEKLLYDEKQFQNIGKSSIVTTISTIVFMSTLYILNYSNLSGIISVLWLPSTVFFILFIFSGSTLYFSNK